MPKPSTIHSAVGGTTPGVLGSATFDAPMVDPNAWSGTPVGTGSFSVATTPTSTGGPSSIAALEVQGTDTWHYVVIGDFASSSGFALAVVSDQPLLTGASTIDGVHRHVVLFNSASGTVTAQATAGTLTLTAAGSAIGQRVTGSLSATMVPVSSQCTVDADCRQGEVCAAGTCVAAPPPPPVCRTNADCAAGQVCQSGSCVSAPPQCRVDADCAAGQVCASGVCAWAPPPQCRTNADCAAGQVCSSGVCISAPPPQCRVDADCSSGEVCQYGYCVAAPPPPPQCTTSAQCARGQVCQSGVCVYPTPTTCSQMQGSGSYSASFGAVAVCSAAGNPASISNGMAALDDSNGALELYIVDAATQTEGVVVQLNACPAAAGTVQLANGDAELYSTVSNASAGMDIFVRRTATGGSVTFSQVGTTISGTLSLTFAGGGSLSGSFTVQ